MRSSRHRPTAPGGTAARFAGRGVIAALALFAWACGATRGTRHRDSGARPTPGPSPAANRPVYSGVVRVDPAHDSIDASWRIAFARDAGADSVVLLLNRTLVLNRVSGTDVLSHSTGDEGGLQRITVRLRPASNASATTTLEIGYAGRPRFGGDSINGIDERWVELGLDSHWHPVFASYAEQLRAEVDLLLPPSWSAAASGTVSRRGDTLHISNTTPLIDIAFSASPALHRVTIPGVTIAHAGTPPAEIAPRQRVATACRNELNRRYGRRDSLPPATVVLAPRTGPGYARKNYIVITSRDTLSLPLTRFLCHEVAHYWSTGAISSGPENWINEGFAEYAAGRAIRSLLGAAAYDSTVARWTENGRDAPAVWTPSSRSRPNPRSAYSKAPLLLHELEGRAGEAAMDRVLTRLFAAGLSTTPALLDIMRAEVGAAHADWFLAALQR